MGLPGNVRAQEPFPAQQQGGAGIPGQKAVIVAAAPAQPPTIRRRAHTGDNSQVNVLRHRRWGLRGRLRNAVRAGAQHRQVLHPAALHAPRAGTQGHAQLLAIGQNPLQQGPGTDLPAAAHKGEHRAGPAVLLRLGHMVDNGPVGELPFPPGHGLLPGRQAAAQGGLLPLYRLHKSTSKSRQRSSSLPCLLRFMPAWRSDFPRPRSEPPQRRGGAA